MVFVERAMTMQGRNIYTGKKHLNQSFGCITVNVFITIHLKMFKVVSFMIYITNSLYMCAYIF